MAKYRIIGKMFLAPWVYDPAVDPQMCAEVELPDNFVPNFNMVPLDAPAKSAFEAYEKRKSETPGVVTYDHAGRPSANPLDALSIRGVAGETDTSISARGPRAAEPTGPLNPGATGKPGDKPTADKPSALSPATPLGPKPAGAAPAPGGGPTPPPIPTPGDKSPPAPPATPDPKDNT